jgi:hypothetical protein
MAINTLICYSQNKHLISNIILFQKTFFEIDCLELAVISDSKKFIALKDVQDLLRIIWFGGISNPGYLYWKV